MERLIAEMLALAREDERRAPQTERIDLDDLLSDLRRDLPLLGPRDYTVDNLTGSLEADPDRLAQVLRNLVRNAVTHTAEGGKITVTATAFDDRVRFEVTDDGPGIAPEEAAHLFMRFYLIGGWAHPRPGRLRPGPCNRERDRHRARRQNLGRADIRDRRTVVSRVPGYRAEQSDRALKQGLEPESAGGRLTPRLRGADATRMRPAPPEAVANM